MSKRSFSIPLPRCEVMAYYVTCSHLRWGDTVVDVGAHIGQNTLLTASLVGPQGRVLAIEPVPALGHQLQDTMYEQGLNNVTLLPVAASSPERVARQKQELQYFYKGAAQNRLWIQPEEARDCEKMPVVCQTVDALTSDIPEIHLLKIDVEGCDVEVLKGATQIIQRSRNLGVLIELWPYGLARNGSSVPEMLRILEDHGMVIYVLDELKKQPVRIDAASKLSLPRPYPDKPESISNSTVQNLWCVRQVWDINYDIASKSKDTVGSIEILWQDGKTA